jgi:hypothetical protein
MYTWSTAAYIFSNLNWQVCILILCRSLNYAFSACNDTMAASQLKHASVASSKLEYTNCSSGPSTKHLTTPPPHLSYAAPSQSPNNMNPAACPALFTGTRDHELRLQNTRTRCDRGWEANARCPVLRRPAWPAPPRLAQRGRRPGPSGRRPAPRLGRRAGACLRLIWRRLRWIRRWDITGAALLHGRRRLGFHSLSRISFFDTALSAETGALDEG